MRHDMVWHGHHENECPLEMLDGTIEGRIADILANKPVEEHPTRLRLLKLVRGPLPPALVAASNKWNVARTRWNVARTSLNETCAAWVAACAGWDEARDKWYAALRDHMPAILALHMIECQDCPWDGHNIFPKR